MDNNYICAHLIKWAELLYGSGRKGFARVENDLFVFGNRKKTNTVTREFALYIVAGKIASPTINEEDVPSKKKIKRSRIKKIKRSRTR
jgi:hypothetical protein